MNEEERAENVAKLKEWLRKLLPEDHDKFDVSAHYDSTLSLADNKKAMREALQTLIKDLKSQVDYTKAQQEQLENQKKNQAQAEVDEYNKRIQLEDTRGLEKFYQPIIRGVSKLCQGHSNLLFIRGRGGCGKSRWIRRTLIENKADYKEICGEVTEAYLYRLIYENNGKILWFKDVVKLLQSIGSLNLLKSATETEDEKILTKSNYSKEQDDLPDYFLCKCKFIFDFNNVFGTQLGQDFEALVTRGDYRELAFSQDDMIAIMRQIASNDWEKEVTEEIISNFNANGIVKLNLRTQWKAFRTRKYAEANALDWKAELKDELINISKTRAMLYSLIGNKAVKTTELKKKLLREEYVSCSKTADRRINDWMYMEELFKWSDGDRDFFVCINPKL